jgi:hypothetical protein
MSRGKVFFDATADFERGQDGLTQIVQSLFPGQALAVRSHIRTERAADGASASRVNPLALCLPLQ